MKKSLLLLALFLLFLPLACNGNPQKDPQTIAKIEELKQDLAKTRTDIGEAVKQDGLYAGGLVKALIGVRIEILKTNEALIQQKIHALESGAKINFQVSGITPNEQLAASLEQEILTKRKELAEAKKEMEQYSGGLVLAMKASAAATLENTIAMMEQQRMIAKYGLSYKIGASTDKKLISVQTQPTEKTILPAEEIIAIKILNKRVEKAKYEENIWFDIEWTPIKLKKPARSIKGAIEFCDLFGEVHFRIGKTINNPLKPGESIMEKGIGFEYNQFKNEHIWVRQTDLKDMTFKFRVTNILYEDGEREEY
jgi:hypothetical protein